MLLSKQNVPLIYQCHSTQVSKGCLLDDMASKLSRKLLTLCICSCLVWHQIKIQPKKTKKNINWPRNAFSKEIQCDQQSEALEELVNYSNTEISQSTQKILTENCRLRMNVSELYIFFICNPYNATSRCFYIN